MKNEVDGPIKLMLTHNIVTGEPDQIEMNGPPFRKGTVLPRTKLGCIFQGAGMGDFICFMPAIKWVAENNPWIIGRVFAPKFLGEFIENVMLPYEHWDFRPLEELNQHCMGYHLRGANFEVYNNQTKTTTKQLQLFNGTGAHLVDVGFAYFANMLPPPAGADAYPKIHFSHTFVRKFDMKFRSLLGRKYVVFTPGGVSAARTVPGHYWNPILEYVKECGATPVLLGKRQMDANHSVKFPEGLDATGCIDLIDKTSVMEAAYIMNCAAVVTGFDNGLVQLASCTDANIICAYNIVHPIQRQPHRPESAGWFKSLVLDDKELECNFCQTKMKNMNPHNFGRCLYGDLRCIDLLFDNGGDRWKKLLSKALLG